MKGIDYPILDHSGGLNVEPIDVAKAFIITIKLEKKYELYSGFN